MKPTRYSRSVEFQRQLIAEVIKRARLADREHGEYEASNYLWGRVHALKQELRAVQAGEAGETFQEHFHAVTGNTKVNQ
jgi:hypothetical protein